MNCKRLKYLRLFLYVLYTSLIFTTLFYFYSIPNHRVGYTDYFLYLGISLVPLLLFFHGIISKLFFKGICIYLKLFITAVFSIIEISFILDNFISVLFTLAYYLIWVFLGVMVCRAVILVANILKYIWSNRDKPSNKRIPSVDVITHYDLLVDEGNDPVYDDEELKVYMDKYDGQIFIDKMCLDYNKTVLEIGVGTGRVALKTAGLCKKFDGIDISPKTVERATENLKHHNNVSLYCGDFLSYKFNKKYDVVYSTLTFMHIEDKQSAINKVCSIINDNGIFVLSVDKNQQNAIDYGTRNVKVFPDSPEVIRECIQNSGLTLTEELETEFSYVFVSMLIPN